MTLIGSYSSDVKICLFGLSCFSQILVSVLSWEPLSHVSSTWQGGLLEDSPGMPVTCLLGVVDFRSFWMTEPYSILTSASLSGVGLLLRLLQMQFSRNQLDSCPPVVHSHIRDSWLSTVDILCQGFSLSKFLEDD